MNIAMIINEMTKISDRENLGYKFETKTIFKNNTIKDAILCIREGYNIAPTLYPEYSAKTSPVEIAEELIALLKENKDESIKYNIDFSKYDPTKIKGQVINTNKNTERLKTLVSREIYDLSVIYRFSVGDGASFVITKEIAETWGVDESQLFEDATRNFKAKGNTLMDYLSFRTQKDIEDINFVNEVPPAAFITNQDNTYGAFVIAISDILESILDNAGLKEIYIIPSSIHEIIIQKPMDGEGECNNIRDIISTVNSTILKEEEYLSDSLYLYSKENGLRIVG